MATKRWMKNLQTGAKFPYHEAQVKAKPHMVECDEEGLVKVEHMSIAEGDMLETVERLVEEKRELKDENLRLEKLVMQYEAAYGSIDSKLPEAKKPTAEKPAPKPEAPETEERAPVEAEKKLTKAQVAKMLLEENEIEVDPKKYKLSELLAMKDEADKATPDEINDLLKTDEE